MIQHSDSWFASRRHNTFLGSTDGAPRDKVDQDKTFASSRKVSPEKAVAAYRALAPGADEELLGAKALRTYPQ